MMMRWSCLTDASCVGIIWQRWLGCTSLLELEASRAKHEQAGARCLDGPKGQVHHGASCQHCLEWGLTRRRRWRWGRVLKYCASPRFLVLATLSSEGSARQRRYVPRVGVSLRVSQPELMSVSQPPAPSLGHSTSLQQWIEQPPTFQWFVNPDILGFKTRSISC